MGLSVYALRERKRYTSEPHREQQGPPKAALENSRNQRRRHERDERWAGLSETRRFENTAPPLSRAATT